MAAHPALAPLLSSHSVPASFAGSLQVLWLLRVCSAKHEVSGVWSSCRLTSRSRHRAARRAAGREPLAASPAAAPCPPRAYHKCVERSSLAAAAELHPSGRGSCHHHLRTASQTSVLFRSSGFWRPRKTTSIAPSSPKPSYASSSSAPSRSLRMPWNTSKRKGSFSERGLLLPLEDRSGWPQRSPGNRFSWRRRRLTVVPACRDPTNRCSCQVAH
jgi:hypothetical protein